MNIIRTIDLWTEPNDNQYECFNGAFVDGFENNKIPWGMSHGHRFTANKYWCLFVMNWVAVHWNNVKKVNYKR